LDLISHGVHSPGRGSGHVHKTYMVMNCSRYKGQSSKKIN